MILPFQGNIPEVGVLGWGGGDGDNDVTLLWRQDLVRLEAIKPFDDG